MIKPADVHGQLLAMLMWGTKPDGSDDVAVVAGLAHWDGHRLMLTRNPPATSIAVLDEWLDRIRTVDPDARAVLMGADYCFSVKIGLIPDGTNMDEYVPLGLR